MEAEQLGLTIEQIAAGAPPPSGVYLVRCIIANEVAAGRVIEQDGRYALSAELWTPAQLAALRGLG